MNKTILIGGLVLGILAVVLGAFGAHGLKKVLTVDELTTFETGVKYQMYHALFLVALSSISMTTDNVKKTVFYLVIVGVVFFSFSIYGLATNKLTSFDFKKIAIITPVGGTLLIAAWSYLLFSILTKK
ncbi:MULTISPECIES: DUF423 domain-containing protein [Flavobacteriaceae]|uniref:DUF423 domain-containing protein n=1 Tax=Flavobacteriaceae TaxID=49546 RepID=UPI0010ADE80A|nr:MULTISPECIES: DUF423 domain-containing protein [Flavobacteriaceae]NJB36782.1 DUF423 domain-containing protein [Croceivirga sp. JEA036]TKD65401.1 DUF423 domain-containing protein [Flavobacterium sp. ASW18X]